MEVEMTTASPVVLVEQDANGASNPPAGIVTVKWTAEPAIDPDTVPLPFADVPVSTSVTVPVNVAPDCVTTHVIVPGPVESVAVPAHVPAMFTASGVVPVGVVGDGVVGDDPLPLLPQAAHASAAASARILTVI